MTNQRPPTVRIYQGADGQWYWRCKAPNNETVASGEGYKSRAGALRGFDAARRNLGLAVVVVDVPAVR